MINHIIDRIDSKFSHINPTQIYNEGWLTRLLTSQSVIEKTKLNEIDFGEIKNWTSEALISSPFIKVTEFKEGYTHPDIALGDFVVDYEKRGEIILSNNAKLFGVIEAKMQSDLAIRTKNFKNYNQVTRSIVCICNQTYNIDNCNIFFTVVAPKCKIKSNKITNQLNHDTIINQIEERFNVYSKNSETYKIKNLIISKAESCVVIAINYEDWIESIVDNDSKVFLNHFYNRTKKWNKIN